MKSLVQWNLKFKEPFLEGRSQYKFSQCKPKAKEN